MITNNFKKNVVALTALTCCGTVDCDITDHPLQPPLLLTPYSLLLMQFAKAISFLLLLIFIASDATAIDQPSEYRGAAEPATNWQIFGQGVRETTWLSPADEARGFHLPPGFVAELVAAEPQIAKPLNMAFDHRGRLWVTCTVEYPYAVPEGMPSRDTIRILEDTNGDGTFDNVKIFADQLNIPIGLLPVADGVICFSIPNLWLLRDTDGDDVVDQRVKLLGPFDTTRDTHGMVNALRQGNDGWIYACHGFSNQSSVTAADGSKVDLRSGNTFRFLPDGSRIEQYTHGQVNPFGMCSDEWGNWYTADCHSKPLTQLLAGACYPSFGRPHDGLGFAPSMMDHLHGSTAICGVEYYRADQFPAPYRHLFYSGNVMTSRINCNAIVKTGATVIAREQADFMTSEDPWFRPVDIIQGADGALYIADFYNKIIGHYEVPLTHPDRDRESGRIWRIRYQPSDNKAADQPSTTKHSDLASTNWQARRQAVNSEMIQSKLTEDQLIALAMDQNQNLPTRQSAVELLTRRGQLSLAATSKLLSNSPPLLQVQVLRSVNGWSQAQNVSRAVVDAAKGLLSSPEAEVVKAATECLGRWDNDLDALVRKEWGKLDNDPMLHQAARIAARNILQRQDNLVQRHSQLWRSEPSSVNDKASKWIAGVLPGVPSPTAAQALLQFVDLQGDAVDTALRQSAIEHASRFPSEQMLELLIKIVERTTQGEPRTRAAQIVQIADTFPPQTKLQSVSLRGLAALTISELTAEVAAMIQAEGVSMQWLDQAGKPWKVEPRRCQDEVAVELLSSLTRGEDYTGRLESEPFACPKQLRFWLAGHNGFPDKPDQQRNFVALVHAQSGQQLAKAYPPRNDIAMEVAWNLDQHAGQKVKLQVVDGDNNDAYAWLGVARFSTGALQIGSIGKSIESLATLLRQGFADATVMNQLRSLELSPRQRAGIVAAFQEGAGQQLAAALTQQAIVLDRTDLISAQSFGQELDQDQSLNLAQELCRSAAAGQQSSIARALLKSEAGCELLSQLLQRGWLNSAALKGASTLLPKSLSADAKELLQGYLQAADAASMDTAVVSRRLTEIDWSQADAGRGKQLFQQHCANCHQLSGQGALIGPQLDGAVQRSVDRLAEDLLLPNLNVDRAFRTTVLLLEDGSIVTGLIQEESDSTLRLVNNEAKVLSISKSDLVDRKDSEQSLMPANLAEVLDNGQLADLLDFLSRSGRK